MFSVETVTSLCADCIHRDEAMEYEHGGAADVAALKTIVGLSHGSDSPYHCCGHTNWKFT